MTRAPIRIALIGKSGSGKSTVAALLKESHEFNTIKTGVICRNIAQLLFGNDDKRSTQLLDDALTQIDPSIFLKASLRNTTETDDLVIDALRFKSDLYIALDLGCQIIRVTADDTVRVNRLNSRGQAFDLGRDGNHRSETELDHVPVDFEITNSDDIDYVRVQVIEMLGKALT